MMYVMYMMVRKQLYLEAAQDRALKRRAKALGVSEADVVRAALDVALETRSSSRRIRGESDALAAVLARARQIARTHATRGERFVRDELYEERERRWVRAR